MGRSRRTFCDIARRRAFRNKDLKIVRRSVGETQQIAIKGLLSEAEESEWARCAESCEYWIDKYMETYSPKDNPLQPWVKFTMYEHQRKLLREIIKAWRANETILIEKSRDQGASWVVVAFVLWLWLFQPGIKCGMGTRSKDQLDKLGDPDSLMEKIRMAIRRLPKWMWPAGYRESQHAKRFLFQNPAHSATITGEAGKQMGRGGRSGTYVLDEFAFVAQNRTVWKAVSGNADFCIVLSTPNGVGDQFEEMVHSENFPVVRLHWKDDPRKNAYECVDESGNVRLRGNGFPPSDLSGLTVVYPWEVKKRAQLNDDSAFAQEYDIDYTASLGSTLIPGRWVEKAVLARLPQDEDAVAGLDVADGGRDSTVLVIRRGSVVTYIEAWKEEVSALLAAKILEVCMMHGVKRIHYDAFGPGATLSAEMVKIGDWAKRLHPLMVGDPASDDVWPGGEGDTAKTSRQLFANLRAELAFKLRERFRKTFEVANGDGLYPDDELIQIPNNVSLKRELSQPQWQRNSVGKGALESKEKMAKRLIKSPDYFDSTMYAFASVAKQPWYKQLDGVSNSQ